MKKFKPIIRCVIFLAGLAAIMGVIDFACVQTGYVNYILRNVCAKDNGTDYDTVVIGASHARASSDPEQIDKNAGTYSINMAIPGETVKIRIMYSKRHAELMILRRLFLILIISIISILLKKDSILNSLFNVRWIGVHM